MSKRTLLSLLIIVFSLILLVFNSCDKEDTINYTPDVGNELVLEVFQPTYKVEVQNGMLSFESKLAFDVTKLEIVSANRKSVDLWEQRLNIKTPANIFNKVILAEDSISKYYENLPENEQKYWRMQPEVHSVIYQQALASKIIQLLPDGEGGEYFDLNLYDKTAASVINLDGFVIVEGQIHQYTTDAIKIITDGDVNKIEELKKINETCKKDNMVVTVFNENRLKSVYGHTWTQISGWQNPENRKRVRVWIDGHSETYGDPYYDDCTQYLNCTYVVRAEAQKKNFWGNWKYSDYMPSFSFNATWGYSFRSYACDPYIEYGCGLYDCEYNYVPAYSCTANPSYMCPTSPHSAYYPSVNNAFINLTPHGVWSSSPKYFSDAFTVHGSLNATIANKDFFYNW
jgi:hypothetical protein